MNMEFRRKLPIPKEVKEMYPISEELVKIKEKRDNEIKAVFSGKSDKFILVIGPCSADSETVIFVPLSQKVFPLFFLRSFRGLLL